MEELAKQVKILKIYAIVLTIIVIACIAAVFKMMHTDGHFNEITAGRINIVEQDGKLRMVISNHENQHPGSYNGKDLPKRDRPAGMIFFNDDGDECGGLVYDGSKKGASMTYSIDQYKNDQIMQVQYAQDKEASGLNRSYGLKLWDRDDRFPTGRLIDYVDSLKNLKDTGAYNAGIKKVRAEGWLGRERLFVGKDSDGEVGLFLRDDKGTPRLKIYINKQNQPVIATLDDKGKVIATR
ncbi:hypothetical protein ACPPVU_19465 [Mucilaginibacter sp. McL0603]|uniref:hypothetical protein n=1 Tax=Mucilaginibacter sp. McL0603 TaxID=3415670 RepID=UPI003CF109DA